MQTDLLQTSVEPSISDRQRRIERAVNCGLGVNVALAIGKTLAGIAGHSQALLADGINSTSDVAYYIIIKIFVRLAGKPADPEHPYGHHQFESIAALVVGAFVVTTAIAIFWDSVNKVFDLLSGQAPGSPILSFALWVALVTIAIKVLLMVYTTRIGKDTKNPAVSALARDHRNDIFSAAGAATGIVLGLFGFNWVDPVAGALVALVVLKTGIEIMRESSADLMDTVPSEQIRDEAKRLLADIKGIEQIEEIHAHRFGPYLVINVTVGIDGSLTVREGDSIANDVEDRLVNGMELVRRVYVHYHPARPLAPEL